jgi:predicted phage tail protein
VPTGFDAVGKTVTVECVWDDATDQYLNHSHTELWRSETNDIGTAGIVKPVIHTRYTDTVDPGSSLYYWIRHVSKADVPGPFNAVAGKHVETGTDPAAILELLESKITSSQLHQDLLEPISLITADESTVGSVAQKIASNILVEHNARMVADGIIADSVAQLDTRVDDNYASVQQKFTTYDGIYAQWTIKTDVNGHIAGVGLMNDGVTSSFVILASNFSVLDPNDPSKVVIGTYNGLAVIEGAYIKAASVDTLQLAGQAVTIPASGKVSGTSTLNGQTYTAVSKLFSSVGKPVFISGHVIISGMAIDCTVALKRGSVTLYSYSVAAAGYDSNPNGSPSYKSAVIPCPIAEKDTPPAGDHTYSIVVTAVGVAKIKSRIISLIGVKDT